MGIAAHPHALECLFGALPYLEAIHRNEHGTFLSWQNAAARVARCVREFSRLSILLAGVRDIAAGHRVGWLALGWRNITHTPCIFGMRVSPWRQGCALLFQNSLRKKKAAV
jgi:hypothetical protein